MLDKILLIIKGIIMLPFVAIGGLILCAAMMATVEYLNKPIPKPVEQVEVSYVITEQIEEDVHYITIGEK